MCKATVNVNHPAASHCPSYPFAVDTGQNALMPIVKDSVLHDEHATVAMSKEEGKVRE